MIRRTWPYGTMKHVKVIESRHVWHQGVPVRLSVVVDERDREGYILLDAVTLPVLPLGERGTITFTAGGPTGGHWRYASAAEVGSDV